MPTRAGRRSPNSFTRARTGVVQAATRANTQPAFGCYLQDPGQPAAQAAGLLVLTLADDQLSSVTRFMDTRVFQSFGLPPTLPTTGLTADRAECDGNPGPQSSRPVGRPRPS